MKEFSRRTEWEGLINNVHMYGFYRGILLINKQHAKTAMSKELPDNFSNIGQFVFEKNNATYVLREITIGEQQQRYLLVITSTKKPDIEQSVVKALMTHDIRPQHLLQRIEVTRPLRQNIWRRGKITEKWDLLARQLNTAVTGNTRDLDERYKVFGDDIVDYISKFQDNFDPTNEKYPLYTRGKDLMVHLSFLRDAKTLAPHLVISISPSPSYPLYREVDGERIYVLPPAELGKIVELGRRYQKALAGAK